LKSYRLLAPSGKLPIACTARQAALQFRLEVFMGVLVRAVVSGFGFSLGSAIYKKVSKRLGLEDEKPEETEPSVADDGEIDSEDDDASDH